MTNDHLYIKLGSPEDGIRSVLGQPFLECDILFPLHAPDMDTVRGHLVLCCHGCANLACFRFRFPAVCASVREDQA
ncbi:hypothetical protein MAR_024086 [Mya arenaria]|uniref:Uncharacterized protein n=1 Tax=Mya arenaria TaxID=6604 RepID=A0ABY7DS35_MYAAR|nr:hypothetical protein MAR_024086 [Mya arenaria]